MTAPLQLIPCADRVVDLQPIHELLSRYPNPDLFVAALSGDQKLQDSIRNQYQNAHLSTHEREHPLELFYAGIHSFSRLDKNSNGLLEASDLQLNNSELTCKILQQANSFFVPTAAALLKAKSPKAPQGIRAILGNHSTAFTGLLYGASGLISYLVADKLLKRSPNVIEALKWGVRGATIGECLLLAGELGTLFAYGLVRSGLGHSIGLNRAANAFVDSFDAPQETSGKFFQAVDSTFEFLGLNKKGWLEK